MESQKFSDISMVTSPSSSASSLRKSVIMVVACSIAFALSLLAWSSADFHESVASRVSGFKRGLLELTLKGEPMPVPFYIDRQDVASKYKVQDAFAVMYYLRDKTVNFEEDGISYTISFFEGDHCDESTYLFLLTTTSFLLST